MRLATGSRGAAGAGAVVATGIAAAAGAAEAAGAAAGLGAFEVSWGGGRTVAANAGADAGALNSWASTKPRATPTATPTLAAIARRRGDSRRVMTICVSVTAARAWSAVTVWVPAANAARSVLSA